MQLLDQVEQLVKDTPPVDNKSSRFGNPAFKDFYDKAFAVSALALSCKVNLTLSRPLRPSIKRYLVYRPRPSQRSPSISTSHGEIELGSTMEVEWSSTFYVGCEPLPLRYPESVANAAEYAGCASKS